MNVNETIAKLAMIGLKGKFQATSHADYARVYVMQAPLPWGASVFSKVRTAISNGIPASSNPTTLTSDVRLLPGICCCKQAKS